MASFMSVFKYLEIQLDDIKSATNNFHDSRVIGAGGFGKVYKGELSRPEGKIKVAFKRLDRKHGQGDPEFFKEIKMLSSYKHDNLICLLGYCNEGDEMILTYEYASRGSLDRILDDATLTWTQRLNICLGAAKGLSFLHDPKGTQQRVLHLDIKSANILLDENLNAKVADFGLSKISPANQSYTFLVTNPVGTPGYCDPLYMDTYQLTKESDVYSFGVLLFEVLCGRVCYENSNAKLKVFVPYWKECYEQKKLDEIIFPYIKKQLDPSSVETFADIAYQCLQKTRELRPTMSVVVENLEAALDLKKLHDLELHEYREILQVADPPLIYKSVKELKDLVSKGFPVNNGKTLLSLNNNGEVCEMIGIEACLNQDEIDDDYLHDMPDKYHSIFQRFYRTNNEGFTIHTRTQFLTPLIDYTVNLVFFIKSSYKQEYVALRYYLEGETENSIVYLANESKDNRFFTAELYQFTSKGRTIDLEIVVDDHEVDLKVEGILFQPLEKDEHEQALEDEEVSNDSLQWTMKEKGSGTKLLKRFHIDKGQQGYAVDNNGKKSLIFSARRVLDWMSTWSSQSLPESRFGEVIVVPDSSFFINQKIKSNVLSPETTYACYLVYKLPQDQSKFKGLLRIKSYNDLQHEYPYIYLVSPPETPFIGQKPDQNSHHPSNRPKLNVVPRQRSDGWMEVKVIQFQTPNSAKTVQMDFCLEDPSYNDINGLIIESIEIRPVVGHSV